MYSRRKKPKYIYSMDIVSKNKRLKLSPFFIILFALLIISSLLLRDLATKIAESDATDAVTKAVNDAINDVIGKGNYDLDYFVSFEKNTDDEITAVSSNMAHINMLSTEILNSVISSTDNGVLKIQIPVGNLSGLNTLMNKGPDIETQIIMLTSSRVDFKNEIKSCGINQAKYQLVLEVTIDIDILVPWGTQSTSTVTEVIVADTVIVGKVPDTFLNMEN